jgi:hypothetical protein
MVWVHTAKRDEKEAHSHHQATITKMPAPPHTGNDRVDSLAHRALAHLEQAMEAAANFNDHGSVLGAFEGAEDIHNDLADALRRCTERSQRLVARIEKWESGDRDVGMLEWAPRATWSSASVRLLGWAGDDTFRILQDAGFIWTGQGQARGENVTWLSNGRYPDAAFDHLLVRPAEGVSVGRATAEKTDRGVSDHRPLTMMIEMEEKWGEMRSEADQMKNPITSRKTRWRHEITITLCNTCDPKLILGLKKPTFPGQFGSMNGK